MEKCPFCGWQLISCGCSYKHFYSTYDPRVDTVTWELIVPNAGLPEDVYENGLQTNEYEQWESILEAKGRVPYIVYPNICGRCGELWPEMFSVPDEEWQHYIRIDARDLLLCRTCYDEIKRLIDSHQHNT
jgi:hypothetical protein